MANLGRFLRTVRHLDREQILFRLINRGKRFVYRSCGSALESRSRQKAKTLSDPEVTRTGLLRAAHYMLTIQGAKFGGQEEQFRRGTFTFLNRTVDFGNLASLEWRRDLGERNNPLWRMNLSYFGFAVPWMSGGREEDVKAVAGMISSLELQNSWSTPGVFRDVWFSYSLSHRIINLLAGTALWVEAGGDRTNPGIIAIGRHINLCALLLANNLERELQFNHLSKNLVALRVYEEATGCRLYRASMLFKSIEDQILSDGGHIERSPMYHVLFMQDLYLLDTLDWSDGEQGKRIRKCKEHLREALEPMIHRHSRRIALMNDSWLGESLPPSDVLDKPPIEPPRRVELLPTTGYARLSDQDWSLILDCGPVGPDSNLGHAHGDFLSIEVQFLGLPVLVDPGTPIYTEGTLRDWCRSAKFHNGPGLEGEEPLEFWKSFRVGRRGKARILPTPPVELAFNSAFAALQTGYDHLGCRTGRLVALTEEGVIVVVDAWRGVKPTMQPVVRWLFPQEWNPAIKNPHQVDLAQNGQQLVFEFHRGSLQDEGVGDYYEKFGKAETGRIFKVIPAQSQWIGYSLGVKGAMHPTVKDLEPAAIWLSNQLRTNDR